MSKKFVLAACLATASSVALANPFEGMKSKVKEGQYETKMTMDLSGVPGMPKGMGTQTTSFSNCVTADDIAKGKVARSSGSKDGKAPDNCEVKNFKMSGNTATYTMVCTGGPDMTADTRMTFVENGYDMDMKMAMNQGGQVMNMTQRMESRHVGPCKK